MAGVPAIWNCKVRLAKSVGHTLVGRRWRILQAAGPVCDSTESGSRLTALLHNSDVGGFTS